MHRDKAGRKSGATRLVTAAALAWGLGQALTAAAETPALSEAARAAESRQAPAEGKAPAARNRPGAEPGRAGGADETAAINAAELRKCMEKLPRGTRHEFTLMPLRDGVRLATDVFLPPTGKGPWPVMLLRTPHSRFDPR